MHRQRAYIEETEIGFQECFKEKRFECLKTRRLHSERRVDTPEDKEIFSERAAL